MSEPAFLCAGCLNEGQAEVFNAWQERCHEIYLEQGEKLDLCRDAMPILVSVIKTMRPELSTDESIDLSFLLFKELGRALDLAEKEAEGAC